MHESAFLFKVSEFEHANIETVDLITTNICEVIILSPKKLNL